MTERGSDQNNFLMGAFDGSYFRSAGGDFVHSFGCAKPYL